MKPSLLWALSATDPGGRLSLDPQSDWQLRVKTASWQAQYLAENKKLYRIHSVVFGGGLARSEKAEIKKALKPFSPKWFRKTKGEQTAFLWEKYAGRFSRILYTTLASPLLCDEDLKNAIFSEETRGIRSDHGGYCLLAGSRPGPVIETREPLPSIRHDYLSIGEIICKLDELTLTQPEIYTPRLAFLNELLGKNTP